LASQGCGFDPRVGLCFLARREQERAGGSREDRRKRISVEISIAGIGWIF
jgi:hypothetical protein